MIKCNKEDYNKPCIYKLTCLKNGLIYVGKTNCFSHRIRRHRRCVNNPDYKNNVWWYKVFNVLYGATSFDDDYLAEIIEVVEDPELRNEREKYWINKLNSRDRTIGFNIGPGGADSQNFFKINRGNKLSVRSGKEINRVNFYFVYDDLRKDVSLYAGTANVTNELHTHKSDITCERIIAIHSRYIVLPAENTKRQRRYKSWRESITKKYINGLYTSNISDAFRMIARFIDMEEIINRSYNYDDFKDHSYDSHMKQWEEFLLKLYKLRVLNGCKAFQIEARVKDTIDTSVILYDIYTGDMIKFTSDFDAFIWAGIEDLDKMLLQVRRGLLIQKKYAVYYPYDDLRYPIMRAFRDRKLKSNRAKANMQINRYMIGYIKTDPNGNFH